MLSDNVPIFPFNRIQMRPARTKKQPVQLPFQNTEQPNRTLVKRKSQLPATDPSGPKDIQADARRFLRTSKSGLSFEANSSEWLGQAGLNVRRSSDAQHIQALAFAYAASIQIAVSPNRTSLIAELETLSGRKRSRATTDLHLVVERFISYGGESAAERLAAKKLVSRDVRAIEHLQSAKVLPSQVAALAAARGEGLHAWARRTAAVKRVVRADDDPAEQARQNEIEAGQRALIHEVTIITTRAKGRRIRRRRFTVTGLLQADLANCLERLKRLGSRC